MPNNDVQAVPRGTLRPETPEQRSRAAVVTDADKDELRARMAALTTPGQVLDESGQIVTVPAAKIRAMLEAREP